MTHMILPEMLRRNRGVVLNIGSISGAFSTPLATVYAATKVPYSDPYFPFEFVTV